MARRVSWQDMAEDGARKLAAMEAASRRTMAEAFSIRHMRLYVAVCRRFERSPALSPIEQDALAARFVRAGDGLARRYGASL